MKTYTKMTLGDLIEALEALPKDAQVRGFQPYVESYRGYYERNALEPSNYQATAHAMASYLSNDVGKSITGYKGGDYNVSTREGVYLAAYGDLGPSFGGLEEVEPGVYEPVLIEDGSVW